MKSINKDSTETHPQFPSGEWEGFYLYSFSKQQHKMSFSLNFQNNKITGAGSDDVGAYSWQGTYDKEAMTCQLIKSYTQHQIFYNGHADENGIWGQWSWNPLMKGGGFHIWPKNNADANEAEAVVEESIEIKTPFY